MADILEQQKKTIRETRDLLDDLQKTTAKFETGTYFSKLISGIEDVGDESTLTGQKIKKDLVKAIGIMQDKFDSGEASAKDIAKALQDVQGAMDGLNDVAEDLKGTTITAQATDFTDDIGERFDAIGEKIKGVPLLGKAMFSKINFEEISEKFKTDMGMGFEKLLSGEAGAIKNLVKIGTDAFKTLGINITSSVLLPLMAIGGLLLLAWNRFLEIDATMAGIRDKTGLSGKNLKLITEETRKASINTVRMGLSMEQTAEAATSLLEELSNVNLITEENITFVSTLGKALGVGAGEAAKMYSTFLDMTGGAESTAQSMIKTTMAAAGLVGIHPQVVFQDIANASSRIFEITNGLPETLAKTAIEARRIGLNLDVVVGIAEKLTDFEGSIEAQMNAMALTGRQINLDAARYFAIMGKTDKMLEEVTKQVGSFAEFEAMLPVQRKAFAEAIGLSTGELTKMLRVQEQMANVQEGTLSVHDAFLQGATMSDMLDASNILTPMEELNASFKTLIVTLSEALLPLFKILVPILDIVVGLFIGIADIIKILFAPFELIGEALDKIGIGSKELGNALEIVGRVLGWIVGIAVIVGAAIIMPFTVIGLAIAAVVTLIITYWDEITNVVMGGLNFFKKIHDAMIEAIIWPFQYAWDFLFGNTIWSIDNIAEIFNGIVDVISSIGDALFDAITWPYRKAWEVISGIGSFIGDMLFDPVEVDVTENVQPVTTQIQNAQAENISANANQVIAGVVTPDTTNDNIITQDKQLTINDVVAKLDELLNALATGVDLKMNGAKYGEFLAKSARI